MTTTFIGDWLVSEYVYTPAGEFAGLIRQRRILQPLADVVRVIQHCEPVAAVDGLSEPARRVVDAMNRRAGEYVFDLKLDGKARHYLGEDVIGGGFSWRDGVLTARGMWPRFGYSFSSFSMLLSPERQVTGGKFFTANREVAVIVGLAVPEPHGYPEFSEGEPAGRYTGERSSISPDGELLETEPVTTNRYTFEDVEGMRGTVMRYGPLLEMEIVAAPGKTISAIEVCDHGSGSIAGIWKRFRDEKLSQVDVYFLKK